MNRILIVEDNKTLAKLIAKKIKSELEFEVDIAFSLSEAKLFLKRYKYFLTLVDLNLPDAPNGEIVDYVLKTDNRAIILSASVDKELRKQLLQKNIIGYINKNGVNDINYAVNIIKRLQKNQNHKILVVDSSMIVRKYMKELLENLLFKVITVAHGEEAINILKSNPDISLILTDYKMPVMNGLELTSAIRKTHNKNDISIIAISSSEDDYINAQFLKEGANDYIKKPFSKEEFSCRINNAIEALENIHIVTNHSKRDYLTGLYNRRYFFEVTNDYMAQTQESGEKFTVAIITIDGFSAITNAGGSEKINKVAIDASEVLRANINHHDILAKLNIDEFCVVLKNTNYDSAINILERLRRKASSSSIHISDDQVVKYTISIGAALSKYDTFDEILEQADMMLYNAKLKGTNQIMLT
ncbi:MAG: response regulator [Sulfurimonas sp.]|uniref:GGDEF domain-containing response regulator n=1 Tax=Sulfurimonas sp. TaxID=2022749 RepID=UPI002623E2F0|nr:response regulator [Sulfurimonas sp.]MCW8895752.1 response regulator [Sulfurimonas sp.]MCW8953439.1 response regulator [Sulfurimonas sp.]MCW9067045.1 response regulator [Sulfurimonas sp.]